MTLAERMAVGHGMRQAGALLVFVLIVGTVAALGAAVATPALPVWYFDLVKPALAPESWVLGPVRVLLYLSTALAGWLVWRKRELDRGNANQALMFYGVQLGLNLFWSILFFGFHLIALAAAETILLFVTVAATIHVFRRVSRAGAYLLLPSLVWTGYASILTFEFWSLN